MKNIIKNIKKPAALCTGFLVGTLLLSACSSFFEKDNTPAPAPLANFSHEIAPRLLWSASVGGGAGSHDYLKMGPALSGDAIYTASSSGAVTATNKINGRPFWQVHTGTVLSTGPAAGDGIIVVGGRSGAIIALDQATGRYRWRSAVPGEIIATPAVGDGTVVVKAMDGYTRAFSALDGHPLWSYQQAEPNLVLRGASAPHIHDRQVIVGYANGSLAQLTLANGALNWSQTIAVPEGAFAIQRMIDIDADPILYDRHLYVATYQGKIASLAWGTGDVLWTHPISSYTGMAADENTIYITDATSNVWAFHASSGAPAWQQIQLKYRNISGPAIMGNYVVVGDGEGYVHWLSKQDGHLAGRVALGPAIYAAPIVENNVLYVLTNTGYLAAYTLRYTWPPGHSRDQAAGAGRA